MLKAALQRMTTLRKSAVIKEFRNRLFWAPAPAQFQLTQSAISRTVQIAIVPVAAGNLR